MVHSIGRYLLLLVLIQLLGLQLAAADTFNPPPFPRIAAYAIGNPHDYSNTTWQNQAAKLNVLIINTWPGWTGSMTLEQSLQRIKSINPNIKIYQYINIVDLITTDDAYRAVTDKVNAMHWWLYAGGGSGSQISSMFGGSGNYVLNSTSYTPLDSSGYNFINWHAHWTYQTFIVPNPSLDGFFVDNVFWKPRVDGDWNRDGSSESQNSTAVQTYFRQGYVQYFNYLKALMPGKFLIGNVADWGDSDAVITEYQGQLNGGVMESLIGQSWSPEAWGGWSTLMQQYKKEISAMASPRLAIFAHDGSSATDYQGMRYGLGSCLMGDGYFYYNVAGNYFPIYWFDEYNSNLGYAVTGTPTAAWQNGVYRRDFDNGIVLVNPKGNGTRTVTLETTFKHLSGTQVPSINNGQTTQSVTLKDRDAVILLKGATTVAPAPPNSLQVSS